VGGVKQLSSSGGPPMHGWRRFTQSHVLGLRVGLTSAVRESKGMAIRTPHRMAMREVTCRARGGAVSGGQLKSLVVESHLNRCVNTTAGVR
jgi:hypothetical protein